MSKDAKLTKKDKQDKSRPEKQMVSLTQQEYEELKSKAEKSQEYWDRLLRLQAEFDNTKKRIEKEKLEFLKYAHEGIILEFLSILDDLERILELAQGNRKDFSAFLKGVEMILAHLYEMLKKNGVEVIESEGKPFDPNIHEALLREETDKVEENTIVEELQKGYLINGKVLRTAKVKVAVAKTQEKQEKDIKEN